MAGRLPVLRFFSRAYRGLAGREFPPPRRGFRRRPFRPGLEWLEDRNAPGNLLGLGNVMAEARLDGSVAANPSVPARTMTYHDTPVVRRSGTAEGATPPQARSASPANVGVSSATPARGSARHEAVGQNFVAFAGGDDPFADPLAGTKDAPLSGGPCVG
jgi:hypothetical protein